MNENVETRTPAQLQFRRRPAAYATTTTTFDHKFIAFLISASGVGQNDRVLDLACGSGSATIAFARRCAGAVGIDVTPAPLQRARADADANGAANAAFVLGEIERLPFDDGAFTGSICRFSFHHFANPARVFAEMARVVAPGGWTAISDMTASEDAEKAALQNRLERLCDPTHSRSLPISEFERMFAEHGFRVAMKVERDARLTLDDWIRFGAPPPENESLLRELAADAVDGDKAGLRFARDGDTIRLAHNSVTFVIEKED
ncbi:MAG TPA: class I SAM-dependent methyltransferase [Candidatus Binataceae bacterium]|nr:class I SAM-dependent methyltransferase [Candidatus Binataceae bacterium]